MYIYLKVPDAPGYYLYVTGHYSPAGEFIPEHDCDTEEEAAKRVSWLNGGSDRKCDNCKNYNPTNKCKDCGEEVCICEEYSLEDMKSESEYQNELITVRCILCGVYMEKQRKDKMNAICGGYHGL